ncbi:MAG: hypothetical protein ABI047_15765 [Jatrophihabitantaceae bacterium]
MAGSLTGSSAAPRSLNSLTGPAVVLGVSRSSAGPASAAVDQATRPGLLQALHLVTSVTLAPVQRAPQRPSAASVAHNPSWTTRPAAGFAPTMARGPVATP